MIVRVFFGFCVLCVVAISVVFGYLYKTTEYDSNKIIDYKPLLTTQIYDRNGDLIANVFDGENRVYVKYDDIPGRIIEALVAIEDTSFFEHEGINYEAISRAIIKDVKSMKMKEGASTLTQQLVKNLILTNEKTLNRKVKEMIISLKLENTLTKEQILERYLNHVYFGHGYNGIKTASLGYFRKNLNELDLKEIAILVGIPKSPNAYNPTKNLEASLSRANRVVARMYELGWINKGEYDRAMNEIPIIYNDSLTQNRAPYVTDEVIKEAERFLPDFKTAGYKIYTSIDLKVQDMAQNAVVFGYNEILKRNKDANASIVNGAMSVTIPQTGEILALVGGVDYSKSNFNRATQSLRQPGSSFKSFIYQIALDEGLSPASELEDVAREYNDGSNKVWKPKNAGKKYVGAVSMREALVWSRNLAAINLMYNLGVKKVADKLNEYGLKVPAVLSTAIGSFGISPLEYARFYSVFPSGGVATTPKFINKAVAFDGREIYFEAEQKQIFAPEQVYLMVDMMKDVVRRGTGVRAQVKGIEIAGKTGTSNDSKDAWFCGYTPELLVLTWFGNDDYKPMKGVEGGGRTSAPVFAKFLSEYLKEFPETKKTFSKPSGVFSQRYKGKDELYTQTSPIPIEEDIVYEYGEDGANSEDANAPIDLKSNAPTPNGGTKTAPKGDNGLLF